MRAQDYSDTNANANGHSDRWNVVDSLWQAIRGDLNSLDYTQWWNHVVGENHNLAQANGQSSTFGNLPEDQIFGYILDVITNVRPRLSNTTLVFDSTGGVPNFTSGQNSAGNNIQNIRVTCDVNAIDDSQLMADQLGFVIVTNAYPIA